MELPRAILHVNLRTMGFSGWAGWAGWAGLGWAGWAGFAAPRPTQPSPDAGSIGFPRIIGFLTGF